MLSAPAVGSLSVNVASAALTWLSDPLISRLVVPLPVTPAPVADRPPFVSDISTVYVSVAIAPLSDRLTPLTAVG